MRPRVVLLAGLAGAALLAWLLARQDWDAFTSLLLDSGWGLIWISLFHALPLWLDTQAWRVLLPEHRRPKLGALLLMRWYGESVNSLLPVAQLGGDLLRARLAALAGVPGPAAAASVLVDLTLSVLTLALFVTAGLLLLTLSGGTSSYRNIVGAALGLALLAFLGFWFVQRSSWPARAVQVVSSAREGDFWRSLSDHAGAFAVALDALYGNRRALGSSSVLQFAAWCAGTGEVWLALYFLGHPVSLIEALLIESLVQAIRNAAFAVPGALGVQDGGLMLIGPLAGVPPDAALALSLLKRGRELLLGVPGLLHLYWTSAHG